MTKLTQPKPQKVWAIYNIYTEEIEDVKSYYYDVKNKVSIIGNRYHRVIPVLVTPITRKKRGKR